MIPVVAVGERTLTRLNGKHFSVMGCCIIPLTPNRNPDRDSHNQCFLLLLQDT